MIKKLLWFLLLALPLPGLAQVSTQKVSNTATIYQTNSPVIFNGTATFNSNATFNGTTTNNGSSTLNGDQTINGSLLVTNKLQANGSTLLNGTLRVSNSVNFVQNSLFWAFDSGRYYMGTNDGSGNFDFEVNLVPTATNPNYILIGGHRAGTVMLEGNNNVEILIDRNNNSGGTDEFIVRKDATNGTVLFRVDESGNATVSNNLFSSGNITGLGSDNRLPNQTLASSSNILTGALGDIRYYRPFTHSFGVVTGAMNSASFAMRNPAAQSTDNIQFSAYSNMVLRTVNIFVADITGGQDSGVTNYSLQVFRQTASGGGTFILPWTNCSYFKKRTSNNNTSVFWKLNLIDANIDANDIQYDIRADGATNAAHIAIGGSATWFISE